jgi:hypothetical protein
VFLFVLDREYISVKGVFVFNETPLTEDERQRSFFLFKGGYGMVFSKRWWRSRRLTKLNIKMQTQLNVTLSFGGAANENSANFS